MNAFVETTNGFNVQIIDPLIESRGVRLTWFDCNKMEKSKDKFCYHVSTTFSYKSAWEKLLKC